MPTSTSFDNEGAPCTAVSRPSTPGTGELRTPDCAEAPDTEARPEAPSQKVPTSTGQRLALALRNPQWWLRAVLSLIFALYVRVVAFDKVYDDNVISDWGGGGWRDVPKFFVHDIFGSDGQAHSVYYRPLAMTYEFVVSWVTGGAPGWLHLSAIFLHLGVVVLAYLLGRRLFRDDKLALLTALLFGIHPSKVETVAWIGSSCVDGLAGIFFFASLIAFLNWHERANLVPSSGLPASTSRNSRQSWLAASVMFFAAALLTKETMVSIPVLIAVYLWLRPVPARSGQSTWSAPRLKAFAVLLPYFAVSAVYMAIRHQVIKPPAAHAVYVQPSYTLSNFWTAPSAIWWYLRHLAAPWGLSVEYDPIVLKTPTLAGFVLPAAGLVVLALATWALWRRQRSATALFLGSWFVINLAAPVILAPMVQMHDRYAYLSLYSFCALVAWAILNLGKLSPGARTSSPARQILAYWGHRAAALSVVALWSALTFYQMGFWDDDTKLFERAYRIGPSNARVELQLVSLYEQAGEKQRALSVLDDALRAHPASLRLLNCRGALLADTNQPEAARAAFRRVLQLTEPGPGQPVEPGVPANSRAFAAYQLSKLANEASQFAEGERYARIALAVSEDGAGFHFALAQSLRGQGRIQEADAESRTELRMRVAQQKRNSRR